MLVKGATARFHRWRVTRDMLNEAKTSSVNTNPNKLCLVWISQNAFAPNVMLTSLYNIMMRSYFMMTSWHENAFGVPGSLCGETTGCRSPVDSSYTGDVFFDVSLYKLVNKQSRGRWFETPWLMLRHHNVDSKLAVKSHRLFWLSFPMKKYDFIYKNV